MYIDVFYFGYFIVSKICNGIMNAKNENSHLLTPLEKSKVNTIESKKK